MPNSSQSHQTFTLSIVVPAYNESSILREFIHALKIALVQITPRFEILIINDGSKDHTGDVAEQLTLEGDIRYIELSRNF
ncbi:MAG: hypothetical protein RLY27_940, partial [Pseudomonadota bacterium]